MKNYIPFCLFVLFFIPAKGQNGWQAIVNAPIAGRFDDISFINDSVGWVASGTTMCKTTDGGLTWVVLSTLPTGSGYVRSVEFINDSIGFYGTLATGVYPASLYRTTDGGLTFLDIDSLIPAFPPGGFCGLAHYGNIVIAVGEYNGSAKICKSTNGGLNWSYQFMQTQGAMGLVDCYMFDQNNYLICGQSIISNSANIMRTSDGGATWQEVAVVSNPGFSITWKIFFIANGVGFASVEGQPIIFKTSDYGMSWTEITINHPDAGGFGAIGAINDSTIWVGRQHANGIFETTNGGLSWNYYPNFGNKMDRMTLLDSNHVICSGSTIYLYTKGGSTGIFNPTIVSEHHILNIITNPVKNNFIVEFNIYQPTYGSLDIIDLNGKHVKELFKGGLLEGKNEMSFFIEELNNGIYTLLFRSNEEFISKKIEVMR